MPKKPLKLVELLKRLKRYGLSNLFWVGVMVTISSVITTVIFSLIVPS